MSVQKKLSPWAVILLLSTLVLASCSGQNKSTETTVIGTGEVTKVTIVDTVEATGTITPLQLATVAWKTSGTIAQVNVKVGQTVKAGDILMSLDPDTVPANLISAQSQLVDANQALEQLTNPDPLAISTATQNLASTFTAWQQAQSNLNNAIINYQDAGDYSLYYAWLNSMTALQSAQNAMPLVNASIDIQAYFEAAFNTKYLKASLESVQAVASLHPEDTLLTQKGIDLKAALSSSEKNQTALKAGLDSGSITLVDNLVSALSAYEKAATDFITSVASMEDASVYEVAIKLNTSWAAFQTAEQKMTASIDSLYQLMRSPDANAYTKAQANVQVAESNADGLNLRAPFDAEVLSIDTVPGDVVSANESALILVDRTQLSINVSIEEANAVKLHLDDPATITVEVQPDLALTGIVTYISPVGTANQGVIYYSVTVTLDQADPQIMLNATADVTIQAGQPTEGLVVPVTAVQSDDTGEYVNRLAADGSYQRVTVVSSQILADDTVVVTGDLQVGDQVQLIQQTSSSNTDSGFGGRGGTVIVGP
jgi:HlyD family secretion protein